MCVFRFIYLLFTSRYTMLQCLKNLEPSAFPSPSTVLPMLFKFTESLIQISLLHYILMEYLYSSVRNFVKEDTDENDENWYMTNNNQFTVVFQWHAFVQGAQIYQLGMSLF